MVSWIFKSVEDGQVYVGEIVMGLPGDAALDAAEAKVYVRPPHFDIDHKPNGRGHFRARVVHINSAGPQVKVEVLTEWGEMAHVEVPVERYRSLDLGKADDVYVTLTEERIFIET